MLTTFQSWLSCRFYHREFSKGKIAYIHRNGTFDIDFNNGDKQQSVPFKDVKPKADRANPKFVRIPEVERRSRGSR